MRIAITGTPGVGKTTLASIAAKHGNTVLSALDWAEQHDCVAGFDDEDDAQVIDVDALAAFPLPESCFIDGHLAHMLDVDEIWVLRLDPLVLRARLQARGYSAQKIRENYEAECMDLILQEAMASEARVVQRDVTRRSPEEAWTAFSESQAEDAKAPDLEVVDWSERLLE